MTEQGKNDKYMTCPRCRMSRMTYYNNDDSIKQHVGYDRLNEQFRYVWYVGKANEDTTRHGTNKITKKTKKTDYNTETREYRGKNKHKISAKEMATITCDLCGDHVCKSG